MPSVLGGVILGVLMLFLRRIAGNVLALLGVLVGWVIGTFVVSLITPEGVAAFGRHVVFSVPLPAIGLSVSIAYALVSGLEKKPEKTVAQTEQREEARVQIPSPAGTAQSSSPKPQEEAPSESTVQLVSTSDQPQVLTKVQEFVDAAPTVITLSHAELTLVEWLAEYGKVLKPLRDDRAPLGGRYQEAEEALGLESRSILELLTSLWRKGVLVGDFAFKTLSCPRCNGIDASYELVCAYCKSEDIERQEVIQCSNCGYLGPLLSFTKLAYYECPQCRIRGEDVQSYGSGEGGAAGRPQGVTFLLYSTLFRCNSCGSISEIPRTEFTCKACGNRYDAQYGKYQRFYNFKLKPEYKEYLEKEKRPLLMLYNLLQEAGLRVESPSVLLDSAGTPHIVELLVKRDESPVAAFLSFGSPYRSAGEVLSEAVWLRLEKEIKEVHVLAVAKWPSTVETIAKSFGIKLIDVSSPSNVALRQVLTSVVSELVSELSKSE
ncbi:MAG: hypothetical protein NZ988_05565 [Thaumarchaeota archaeon]|nr:hypothetical protein [Candidatus Calditenuaceae archaeon]MDW8187490.1 hypothetical protein [Nitrososphaerota archaeon]